MKRPTLTMAGLNYVAMCACAGAFFAASISHALAGDAFAACLMLSLAPLPIVSGLLVLKFARPKE